MGDDVGGRIVFAAGGVGCPRSSDSISNGIAVIVSLAIGCGTDRTLFRIDFHVGPSIRNIHRLQQLEAR
jgi:hypothetical protein